MPAKNRSPYLLLANIGQLITLRGEKVPRRGAALKEIGLIEDAAVLCGASPLEAKIRVTLPAISHGLFSAAVFSFLTSWDEVVVAIFMASPTLQTLPVKVWTTLRQDLTPVVAAASTLLILLTVTLMALAAIVRKVLKS